MTEEAALQQDASQGQEQAQAQAVSEGFSIPDRYADRGWTKQIDSHDALWDKMDAAQSLIGKRQIPSQDSSKEDWDKFYDSLGRPKDPDAYELDSNFEGLPDGIDLSDAQTQAKQLAHRIGLTPKQASELWQGYIGIELERLKSDSESSSQQNADLDKQFDDMGSKLFGDKFADVSSRAQAYLRENLPEDLRDVAKDLSGNPKALMAMIALAENSNNRLAEVKRRYGAEDKLASGSQSSGETPQDITSKLNDARTRYRSSMPFSTERRAIESEMSALREQLKRVVK